MLQAIPTNFSLLNRFRKSEPATTPKATYRTHREQHILQRYLPTGGDSRTLNLSNNDHRFAPIGTDYYNPLPTGCPRTPFSPRTFDAVICFRLAGQLNAEELDDLLWEASRICTPGGRLLLTVPLAAKADKYAYTHEEIEDLHGTRWRQVAEIGVKLLNVDRLPAWLSGPAGQLDALLCQTPLKRLAAYRTYVLEKC